MVYQEGSSHSGFYLNIVILYQVYFGNSHACAWGGSCMLYVCPFGGNGLFCGCFLLKYSYLIIYFVNDCFCRTALGGCLIILSTLFIFNLTWKKRFLESTLPWWIFDKYLILHQFSCLLNINSALGMQRGFLRR